jgi:AraC-like DNA-binding protein
LEESPYFAKQIRCLMDSYYQLQRGRDYEIFIAMQNRQIQGANPVSDLGAAISRSFTECDEFSELLRHEGAQVIQTRPGRYYNRITLAPLQSTMLRYGVRSMPWIASATGLKQHVSLLLDLKAGGPVLNNGLTKDVTRSLTLYGSGAEHHSAVTEAGEYAYVPFSIPLLEAAARAACLSGIPVRDGACALLTPGSAQYAHLCETVRAIYQLAESTPTTFGDEGTRIHAERSLTTALVLALASCEPPDHPLSQSDKGRVFRKARDFLHDREHLPIYMLDLCEATGASERTVRTVFIEHFGISPMRYLKLRRLNQVRARLRQGSAEVTSVKEVAFNAGFWDLGRFAGEYKALHGETPSMTLAAD